MASATSLREHVASGRGFLSLRGVHVRIDQQIRHSSKTEDKLQSEGRRLTGRSRMSLSSSSRSHIGAPVSCWWPDCLFLRFPDRFQEGVLVCFFQTLLRSVSGLLWCGFRVSGLLWCAALGLLFAWTAATRVYRSRCMSTRDILNERCATCRKLRCSPM